MNILFNGLTKEIQVTGATSTIVVTAQEIYSRWKDWVFDNAEWEFAFRTFGGDPIGGGILAGDYYFLNTDAGWTIQPEAKNHVLKIQGNLFPENVAIPMFALASGFSVNIQQEFSSLTQTAEINSGSGLDPSEATKLDELHQIHGLNNTNPLVVNKTARYSASGGTITQTIDVVGDEVTVTRT